MGSDKATIKTDNGLRNKHFFVVVLLFYDYELKENVFRSSFCFVGFVISYFLNNKLRQSMFIISAKTVQGKFSSSVFLQPKHSMLQIIPW